MTRVLEEWVGYCCDFDSRANTQHNKVYAFCYTDDGTFHRRFGGVGEKLHEVIDRAPQQLPPIARVKWAREQYRKIFKEKARKYKATSIQFPFPTAIRYDPVIEFDVPFHSPLGDAPYTVPSFTHELEAPLASTMVLSAPTSAQSAVASNSIRSLRCANCGIDNAEVEEFCTQCGMLLRGTASSVAALTLTVAGAQPNTALLAPGTLLKNLRYRIIEQVGKGGFGAVYKVADTELGDRSLAIKEMINQSNMQEASEAFKREALMLASLQHPALPRIYEHFPEGGRWYLVMDFIEGLTLEDYLPLYGILVDENDQTGLRCLPLQEALGYGIQLCAVLDYLHTPLPNRPSIIFRDLKPGNIMRKPDGQLVLVDFGIARHFKLGQQKDTVPLGSRGFAAPEQYGKSQTGPQADIYSLGATLHSLFTGHDPSLTPFFFAPLRTVKQGFPEDLEALVARMVEMEVGKRPPTAKIVQQELERIARVYLAAT